MPFKLLKVHIKVFFLTFKVHQITHSYRYILQNRIQESYPTKLAMYNKQS